MSVVWWRKVGLPFRKRLEFYDPDLGRITDDAELRELLRSNPNATSRRFKRTIFGRQDLWISRSAKGSKIAVTKGSAGILIDLDHLSGPKAVLREIEQQWARFDSAHRVGALSLSPAQTGQIHEVLRAIQEAPRRTPGISAGTVAAIAACAVGIALAAQWLLGRQRDQARPHPFGPPAADPRLPAPTNPYLLPR